MRDRYKPIAVLAAALFVADTLGWFVSWLVRKSDTAQSNVGVVALVLIAAVAGVGGYRWIVRYPMNRALADIGLAIAAGCVASAVLSPFAGGSYPYHDGAGQFFLKIWLFLGAAIIGVLLAVLFAMAIGRDYRDQALKRYAETKAAKPRRVVRR